MNMVSAPDTLSEPTRSRQRTIIWLPFRYPSLHEAMEVQLTIDLGLAQFELPRAVQNRLQALLDRQDQGKTLTTAERQEAEGLVQLAEFLSLLRLRAERAASL